MTTAAGNTNQVCEQTQLVCMNEVLYGPPNQEGKDVSDLIARKHRADTPGGSSSSSRCKPMISLHIHSVVISWLQQFSWYKILIRRTVENLAFVLVHDND